MLGLVRSRRPSRGRHRIGNNVLGLAWNHPRCCARRIRDDVLGLAWRPCRAAGACREIEDDTGRAARGHQLDPRTVPGRVARWIAQPRRPLPIARRVDGLALGARPGVGLAIARPWIDVDRHFEAARAERATRCERRGRIRLGRVIERGCVRPGRLILRVLVRDQVVERPGREIRDPEHAPRELRDVRDDVVDLARGAVEPVLEPGVRGSGDRVPDRLHCLVESALRGLRVAAPGQTAGLPVAARHTLRIVRSQGGFEQDPAEPAGCGGIVLLE
ncbi:MAG TPA: hypothetical protein VHW23_34915 [Kofleriaceae bacterium]|nr:hypothetical protein [Kofleriaceae bacterium]